MKLDLKVLKKKKKKRQRKPDLRRLVIPAFGRPRQDDRTNPVGSIPSKYHRKKGEDRKQCPARKLRPLDASPVEVELCLSSPQAGLKAAAWKPARHFLRALQLQRGSVQCLVTLSSLFKSV